MAVVQLLVSRSLANNGSICHSFIVIDEEKIGRTINVQNTEVCYNVCI
jgi:hypothetical protein